MKDHTFIWPAGTLARCNRGCPNVQPLPREVKALVTNKHHARIAEPIMLDCGHLDWHDIYRADNVEQTWPVDPAPDILIVDGYAAFQTDYWRVTNDSGEFWGEVMAINLADAQYQFEERLKQQQNYDGLDLFRQGGFTFKIHQY